jgi:hypothetical protein
MGKQIFVLILGLFVLIACFSLVIAAGPSGGTLTPQSNGTFQPDSPSALSAFAGNLTDVNIYGESSTQTWQGYYGNVTGYIQLADNNNKTFYNWSLASPSGEIYASNDSSVIWTNIACLNFTANGTLCAEDIDYKGATSRCGINISLLNRDYNVASTDADGINQTFNRRDHASFITNSLSFTTGECSNSKMLNSTGDNSFDEVLLYSPDSKAVIYTALLKNNEDGFDAKTHDFEMLVLEDGHSGNVALINYYFYVEIQ